MAYLKERFQNTIEIFKSTMGMIVNHPKLILPALFMIILSFIPILLVVPAIFFGVSLIKTTGLILYAAFVFIMFGFVFINTFFGAVHSWMVYEVLKGKPASFTSGLGRAFANLLDILGYTVFSLFIGFVVSSLRSQRGGGLIGIFIKAIMQSVAYLVEKGWEYSSYMIVPDMIISDRNFVESFSEIKKILGRVPEYLAGGFAFDYISGFINFLLVVLTVIVLAPFALLGTPIFTLFLWGIGILIILGVLNSVIHQTMKSTYFTVLYVDAQKGKPSDFFKALKKILPKAKTKRKAL